MSEIPAVVTDSSLWKRIAHNVDLLAGLKHLREIAEALGDQVAKILPDYTDHSVRHMDALWGLADHVLKPLEQERFSIGEAFVLGCSFYVHDLGMALASTSEGVTNLQHTEAYRAALSRGKQLRGLSEQQANVIAIQIASSRLMKNAEMGSFLPKLLSQILCFQRRLHG